MATRWRWLATIVVGFALCVPAGCVRGGTVHEDTRLSASVRELVGTGRSVPFARLVGGDWDAVHVFDSPVTRDWVEAQVDAEVVMGEFFDVRGNLLVFTAEGRVLWTVYTTPAHLPAGRYSDRVWLRSSGVTGEFVLRMADEPVAAGKRLP